MWCDFSDQSAAAADLGPRIGGGAHRGVRLEPQVNP